MSLQINRRKYGNMYSPTTGDRVRLSDTELLIVIEKDFTIYGEENKFRGGKTIRDSWPNQLLHLGMMECLILYSQV